VLEESRAICAFVWREWWQQWISVRGCVTCVFFLFIHFSENDICWNLLRVCGITFGVGSNVCIDFVNCVNVIVNIFSPFKEENSFPLLNVARSVSTGNILCKFKVLVGNMNWSFIMISMCSGCWSCTYFYNTKIGAETNENWASCEYQRTLCVLKLFILHITLALLVENCTWWCVFFLLHTPFNHCHLHTSQLLASNL
jgi:hypothetical protein